VKELKWKWMKSIFTAFIFLLFSLNLQGQILKGTIKNQAGEPLAYSTVFIRELKQGTTSNTKGNYEIHLPEGKYTVVFQSLGFAPEIKEITLGKNVVTLNITLQIQYYQIPEIRITASGEDPAYGIMRKVIGLAPYYLNEVSHYTAEVYLKGNLVFNKIPKFLQKSMEMEAKKESGTSGSRKVMKQGESYFMESVNEIEFNAPDKYVQKVISYQSTFPTDSNEVSPMSFIQASFYQPVIAGMNISPLSPQAFSHYRFKYLGSSPQGNFIVNKIEVIPKRKSQQLFEGTLFVIEDLWCLHSIDVTTENIAGKIRIQQLFIPVQGDIWMPVSHKFDLALSIIGVKADVAYGSSIKYNSVSSNTALKKPENIGLFNRDKMSTSSEKKDTSKTRTRKQIEKILSKEELTNRDMARLAGLMEKESKESQSDSAKKSLEVKDKVTHVVEKDAVKKDSAYWAEKRPIPLSDAEYKSIRVRDSIKANLKIKEVKSDSSKNNARKKNKFFGTVGDISFGHTWSDTSGFSFYFNGLIKLRSLNFNTVDGFTYGTNFRFSKNWKDGKNLIIAPWLRYAFSRQKLMYGLTSQYRFDRLHQRSFFLVAGTTGRDFNNNGGINPLLNSISSLFFEENYLKIYESTYLTPGFRTELRNGLYAEINFTLENRQLLSNTTDFSFVNTSKEYTDNIPDNPYLNNTTDYSILLQSQRHANLSAVLTYTPQQRYRIRQDRKIPLGSDWPTFTITWKHGLNEFPDNDQKLLHYDMFRFEASKRKDMGAFREYFWLFRTGGFLNNTNIPFYDFFHFNSQQIPVLLNNYRDAFMLKGYYFMSTPEFYTEAHAKYTTSYLVLKLLPGLSKTLIRENIGASVLWSRYQKCYTEIGYSLSEIFLMGEVGVYTGFDNFTFNSVGLKFVIKIN
jgi:hypothetical protein